MPIPTGSIDRLRLPSRRGWLRKGLARFAALCAAGGQTVAAAASATGNPPARSVQSANGPDFAPVTPSYRLRFPTDHGAHPAFRTEWWYITAWVTLEDEACGIQITFFRSRTDHGSANPSRFAPRQLLLAHAALARPREQRLLHDQRGARTGFGDAGWALDDTRLSLNGWTLARDGTDRYHARLATRGFALDLQFTPNAAPQLQGDNGFSRKGPAPEQASYYYSRPQMAVTGSITVGQRAATVRTGRAWLDHEWSSQVLDPEAIGWDWVGLNLDDGSALMAFRIRRRGGGQVWSHARWLPMASGSPALVVEPVFEPLREWRSARSGARYPVAMRLTLAGRQLMLDPLFDDQELDARASTGAFYWEGAIRVIEAGQPIGRGYLELTGYAAPLRL